MSRTVHAYERALMGDLKTGLGILIPVAMAGGLYPDASIGDPRLAFDCFLSCTRLSSPLFIVQSNCCRTQNKLQHKSFLHF